MSKLERYCELCGTSFVSPHPQKKFCSPYCRVQKNLELNRKYRKQRNKMSKPEERLDEILMGFYVNHPKVVVDSKFVLKQKQAIQELIEERVCEARVEELNKLPIRQKNSFYQSEINPDSVTKHVVERLTELKERENSNE